MAGGLVATALILRHGPPPIAQDSAQKQFRTQVLASPSLHTLSYRGVTHTLHDVRVDQVIYTAQDDQFSISYHLLWQPEMPTGVANGIGCSLSNDGYGHYYGYASFSPGESQTGKSVLVTIK